MKSLPCRSLFFLCKSKTPVQLVNTSTSGADPWHLGPEPDLRIHASDKWIQIRILLFSSLTFKTPTKN
jgi:hypothetical protein